MTDTCIANHGEDTPEADVGHLCGKCFSRLRSTLLELPAVATWLEVNIAAGGVAGEQRVSGSREDPIPLRQDITDLIGPDSLKFIEPNASHLPSFVLWEDGRMLGVYRTWQEAHATRVEEMRLAGVEEPVIRVLTTGQTIKEGRESTVDPAKIAAARERWQIRPTQRGGTDQAGVDAFIAALRYWSGRVSEESNQPWTGWWDRNDLTGIVQWLAARLSWIAHQAWASEFNDEIRKLTSDAHRVAPWRAEIVRDRKPCETCGVAAIIVRMSEGRTVCEKTAGGCGRVITWDHTASQQHARDKPPRPAKTQITTGEAAALARVQPATIRSWARRKKLHEVARDPNNRPLYSTADVVRVAQEQAEGRHELAG
jgi:hypothetical protein